jgi:hypothetical protein
MEALLGFHLDGWDYATTTFIIGVAHRVVSLNAMISLSGKTGID